MAEYSIIPRTTAVKELDVYLATTPMLSFIIKHFAGLITSLYSTKTGKKLVSKLADKFVTGPSSKMMQNNKSYAWVRAKNESGDIKDVWLEAPEAYFLTAKIGVDIVNTILYSNLAGALTPVQAFGVDYILKFEDVKRLDNLARLS
jgi:short subunit dehydrogenase-like uncharacterized protein